jgi:hypothetical protein
MGHNIHRRTCDRLSGSHEDTEAFIGEKLSDLKELRNEADYDWRLDFNHFKESISSVQRDTKLILEQIDSLKTSPPFEL